ncbi:hypothetical protein HUK45_09380, partial [Limosilactobacillus sp. c9Ua_26_M]
LAEMPKDAEKYTATSDKLVKPNGEPTTPADVIAKVKTDYPQDAAKQPTVSVDNPDQLPDGKTPGEYNVGVTVTYPDGTQTEVTVTVHVVGEAVTTPAASQPAPVQTAVKPAGAAEN